MRPEIARDPFQIDERLIPTLLQVIDGDQPWPLTMLGGVGVGKTCTALCLLDRVFGARKYLTTSELVSKVVNFRVGASPWDEEAFWEAWREALLTVLDEIGSREKVSDAHYEAVKRAIDWRIRSPAIFISNLPLEKICEVYDDRVASRLNAGTVVDMFDWEDRRS